MKFDKIFLFAAALGLTPIALSYGVKPDASIPYLFGIAVESANEKHVFRAMMGLYLGQALFWVMGALKPALTFAALWSVVVFMWGLAFGRILSVVLDGVPSPLLLVYLLLEVGFGVVGTILIRKKSA
ncbi:DUF4345 domain-containing protein [Haloferula sp.]|uniref:DUF4345 domain-containing protein n=1 Tax=Haloferula sp. TaxID=2497595 RepID=UPI0032A1274E